MWNEFAKKPLWVHMLVGFGSLLLALVIFFSSLGFITGHDNNEVVLPVLGKNVKDAVALLEAKGFDVEIQDSIYVDTAQKGSVLKQFPEPDLVVKKHRTIYLTIASYIAPMIDMPDLKGYSFRSAELYLQNLGLKVGDTSFKPDIARNAILEQRYNGKPIAPGTKIQMGSRIDFVLGSGVGNNQMPVPDLVGLTVTEARELLASMNIGISSYIPQGTVTDTLNAFIIKQNPPAVTVNPDGTTSVNFIRTGQLMDLWIGVEKPLPVSDTAALVPQP
ncbi:MAG: PASTA domain-containing protein [Bacteroidetes bacterium]|nr:MAG: PASTA domain-containing protein [Bacteroidota bacterium]